MAEKMTICEKILARACNKESVKPGDVVWARPDLILMHAFPGISDLPVKQVEEDFHRKIKSPKKIKMSIDHLLPPSNAVEAKFRLDTCAWAESCGAEIIEGGIGHQAFLEKGLIRPGQLLVHGDSHVHLLGAFNTYPVSLGSDILSTYILDEFWVKVPKTIKVTLTGKFRYGVGGRDLINMIIGELSPDFGIDSVIEFHGDGAINMDLDDRMAALSEIIFCGAYTGIFPLDEKSEKYLIRHGVDKIEPVFPDEGAHYHKKISINLDKVVPYVIGNRDMSDARKLEEVLGTEIQQGYIGSCACGRTKDISIAAQILSNRKIKKGFRLYVVPTSAEIFKECIDNGAIGTLVEAGAFISSPSCDYCYGKTQYLLDGETAISTGVLNVAGRMGSPKAKIYLGSAAVVAASAIEGKIADPLNYLM